MDLKPSKNWNNYIDKWTAIDMDISDMLECAYSMGRIDTFEECTKRLNDASNRMFGGRSDNDGSVSGSDRTN